MDIILETVWRLETHVETQTEEPAAAAAAGAPSPPVGQPPSSNSASSSGAGSSSCSRDAGSGGSPQLAASSSSCSANLQQPQTGQHAAKAEVAMWASYRLVCRRWNPFFRYGYLPLVRSVAPQKMCQSAGVGGHEELLIGAIERGFCNMPSVKKLPLPTAVQRAEGGVTAAQLSEP